MKNKPLYNFFTADNILLGQFCVLQSWFVVADPAQSSPPNWGAGSEQLRERVCLPPPQVNVQDPHEAQAFQFPLTRFRLSEYVLLDHKRQYQFRKQRLKNK